MIPHWPRAARRRASAPAARLPRPCFQTRLVPQKPAATRVRGAHPRRHTCAGFGEPTARLTRALRTLRLPKGDRVATLARNSPRPLEIYWAAPLLGCVLHTLNFRLSAQDLT